MKTGDVYPSFKILARHETEGEDYSIEYMNRKSAVLVTAPHGGMIEPGTSGLAREIAGSRFSYYAFEGIKPSKNRMLHISSHRFDEPVGIQAAARVQTVLALHGCRKPEAPAVLIGGKSARLRSVLKQQLNHYGFAVHSTPPHLRAVHPLNICNQGRSKAGGQLELTRSLRHSLCDHLHLRHRFVSAVSSALTAFEKE